MRSMLVAEPSLCVTEIVVRPSLRRSRVLLTAASVAALTVYDMCKAVDKGMRIEHVRLRHKSGGKSGTYDAD